MKPQGSGSNMNNQGKSKQQGRATICMQEKQKPQWPTDPMENKYNRKNYCCLHGYDTSEPKKSEICSRTMFGHKNDDTRCDPMGVSQNNKARVWKKRRKKGRGDDQKHSSLNCYGIIYNGFENAYVCSNLDRAPTTKINNKQKRRIIQSLIQNAQESSFQYLAT